MQKPMKYDEPLSACATIFWLQPIFTFYHILCNSNQSYQFSNTKIRNSNFYLFSKFYSFKFIKKILLF